MPPLAALAPLAGVIGSAIGGIASLINKPKPPPTPMAPPVPAPQQQPTGQPSNVAAQQTPSFLAAAAGPSQQNTIGGGTGKTLLGQ